MRRMLLVVPILILLAAGCKTAEKQVTSMPVAATPSVEQEDNADSNPGSLFDAAQADYLFSDNRAHRVGDIVMVNIVETSKAKNKADTTAKKENTHSLGVKNWFGKDTFRTPFIGVGPSGPVGSTPLVSATTSSDFKGEGETKRESEVSATVAARVVRMLPGNVMQVEGAREVRVNDETQIIVVRGLVRTSDVGSDNTVPTTKMADAHIEYYGKGVLADKQRPGWLSRLLDNVWPF